MVCVVGPTAVGKTAVAIQLALHYKTVILSADSRQFYREMTIGTAKPSLGELATVPHYFINSHQVSDEYSAGDYERDVLRLLETLFARHRLVILVGGSGLFVDAVCYGLDDLPKPLPGVRDRLNQLYAEQGLAYLQQRLREVDPSYYEEVDIHNPQRVIRALEVVESTGKPFSYFRQRKRSVRPFNSCRIGLQMNRESLYQRINDRVDAMMAAGLLDEVRSLVPYRDRPPLQTVGYAELFDYLDGRLTLEEAIGYIKQHTRRYAKRQLTWFRKNADTRWFEPHELAAIKQFIEASGRPDIR